MNRLLLFTLVIALGVCGHPAPAWPFDEILFIPWGSGPGHAGYRLEPSGCFGPTDFAIVPWESDGSTRYVLLDREQSLLQAFDLIGGRPVQVMATPPWAERVALQGSEIALWDGDALHLGTWGDSFRRTPLDGVPFHTIQRLIWNDGEVMAVDERARAFRLTRHGRVLPPEEMELMDAGQIQVIRQAPRTLGIARGSLQRSGITLPFEVGSVELLGTAGGTCILLVDVILSPTPIQARQVLVFAPLEGDALRLVPVPRVYFTWLPHSFLVVHDTLYGLVSSPRGLHLFAADSARLHDQGLAFPVFLEEPYHLNDHLPSVADSPGFGTRDEAPLSRSQMMLNARAFVNLQWSASSGNITSGIQQLPDGSSVRTPAWVTVGAKQKVPYKWGGFTSTSTFAAGVPLGKKCGDDYTESVSWTDLYCIGVDCSGFVSRCWNTSQKYGTATLSQIAAQLGSFGEMRRGDCLNLVSSHVRLCAEDNPPGMVLTMEASAYDWRVSYRAYTLSALSSYVPMRFDWVIEEEPVAPWIVRVKDGVTTLNVRQGPSISEAIITTITGGQRFASTCAHDGWYHFHIPSGTGVHGGWALGGSTSANGYLEGSQATSIARVTTPALNLREGPGTGYGIITTVAEGQHFAILSSSGSWHELQLCNVPGFDAGWASGTYLAITPGGPRDGYGASVESLSYPSTLNEGSSATVTLELANTGQCSWDTSTLLATTVSRGRASAFAHPGWVNSATVSPLGAAVLPYQSHATVFQIHAPQVGADTAFSEHFGLRQDEFCWFGDSDQRGPADDAIVLSILVHDLGGLAAPVIDPDGVAIVGGQLGFSWEAVAGAASYGVFRGSLAGSPSPVPVSVITGLSYASSHGVGDVDENVRYWVRAYAGADSSDLSQPVGEHDFALP
ncbi:SH3 domain-containing protein [Candidatus Fermentibacteria bacterium]|nr:SH3 domain-containing protein [Candidatus Fermentibacteria bacterium]